MSAASDMSAMVTAILTLSRNKEQHGPALEVFKTMWRNYVTVWDSRLAKQRYAAGNEVTIADFALYGALGRMKTVQPALVEGFANVARWTEEMAARPALQRAMKF
jgi:GST-like protein